MPFLHHFSSPLRAVVLILIFAVFLLMFTSCESGPDLMAPGASGDVAAGIQTDAPESGPGPVKDITMPLVERIARGKGAVKERFEIPSITGSRGADQTQQ